MVDRLLFQEVKTCCINYSSVWEASLWDARIWQSWQLEGRLPHVERTQLWSVPEAVFQKINCFKLKKKSQCIIGILFIYLFYYLLFLLQCLDSTVPDSPVLGWRLCSTTLSHPDISKSVDLRQRQSRRRWHSHLLAGSQLDFALDAGSLGHVLGKATAVH